MNYLKSFVGIKEQYNTIRSQLQQLMTQEPDDLTEVFPRVHWMMFPKSEHIGRLSSRLNSQFHNNYYVWNLSEHSYNTEHFLNQVASHSYQGFPCPPLYELFVICKSIFNWLTKDSENVAIVHCQYTKGRSILVLSLLLALLEQSQPDLCFLRVCEALRIKEHLFFPSQHLYLNYLGHTLNQLPLNMQPVRLVSIVFNRVPGVIKLDELPVKDFCPYVQIMKCNSQMLFNSLEDDSTRPPSYSTDDQGCVFYVGSIEISQDTLIRCKHYYSQGLRYPAFRTMIHTAFIYQNVMRLYARDLDVSATLEMPSDFFIDLIFELGDEVCSQNVAHNVARLDDLNEIHLSENSYIENENEGNNLLQKLVQQCKHEAAQFRGDDGPVPPTFIQTPLQPQQPPQQPQQLLPQPKVDPKKQDFQDEEFEFNVKMC